MAIGFGGPGMEVWLRGGFMEVIASHSLALWVQTTITAAAAATTTTTGNKEPLTIEAHMILS